MNKFIVLSNIHLIEFILVLIIIYVNFVFLVSVDNLTILSCSYKQYRVWLDNINEMSSTTNDTKVQFAYLNQNEKQHLRRKIIK